MNKTNIDWPGLSYTWNPVTGCKRRCSYCYARRIHERFNKTPFSEIRYHPSRMNDLKRLGKQKPSRIFVGSMSDIEYWPKNITECILREIAIYHEHTFMFLTKNAWSYEGINWPENTMQGLTINRLGVREGVDCCQMFNYPHPFLSIEPLLGNINGPFKNMPFDIIIVGAMTGPGAVKPKPEWIQSIKDNVPADKIYWKSDIKQYL